MGMRYYTRTGKHSGVSMPFWMVLITIPFIAMIYLIVGIITLTVVAFSWLLTQIFSLIDHYKNRKATS